MSYFVKGGMGVIDLHPVLDMLADAAADEKIKEDFLQMTKACGALAQAAPPLSPAAMTPGKRLERPLSPKPSPKGPSPPETLGGRR